MPLDGQRTDVLERLWDEAGKSVAAQRVSPPMGKQRWFAAWWSSEQSRMGQSPPLSVGR